MAKEQTKAKPEKKKVEQETFKFGINDIAKALDIKPASARVQLRNAKVKKNGKSYGWNTRAELDEVVKKLAKETSGEKKAPAKKAEAKPAAKKAEPAKKVKKEAA